VTTTRSATPTELTPDELALFPTNLRGTLLSIKQEWYEAGQREGRAAADELEAVVRDHIGQRTEFMNVLRSDTGTDSDGNPDADYYRWMGHAGARRQLAEKLGWPIPGGGL
jgi:hypothetical protein